MKGKIGVGIVTYNSEVYFKKLYESLPLTKIDSLVVVNGGDLYKDQYTCSKWIQHYENKYPAVCRNECIQYLLEVGCEHIFIIEDDMIIKNHDIFDKYINVSKVSGVKYFSFVSTSSSTGVPGKRTPRLVIDYGKDNKIALYRNMCNEFTYHHKTAFDITGIYDTQFRNPFDIDLAYRESQQSYSTPFWWFADIYNSDDFIMNNPNAVSRLQTDRPDGSREQIIVQEWKKFADKHGMHVTQIPDSDKYYVISKLKKIKP